MGPESRVRVSAWVSGHAWGQRAGCLCLRGWAGMHGAQGVVEVAMQLQRPGEGSEGEHGGAERAAFNRAVGRCRRG
eukprot:353517-Chlamydomonas_euryale.AAC.7